MKSRLSEITLFVIVSILSLSCHIYTVLQTLKSTKINVSITDRKFGQVINGLSHLDINDGLTALNSISAGSTFFIRKVFDGKNCFSLSWKHPSRVKSYNDLIRHIAINTTVSINQTEQLCKRYVTKERLSGRIGNQMFQIASVFGVAYSYDIIPVIPNSPLLDAYIDLPNIYHTNLRSLENVVSCNGKQSGVFYRCKDTLNSTSNVTMRGYLQSWKYFDDATNIIRRIFSLKTKTIVHARKFLANVTTIGFQHVCIHVRRGDFLRKINEGYTVADVMYIERAKRFYIKKYPKVDFVLATDDKRWCRENVKDVAISPFESPGDDMALMMLCDHVIVTSGTFGWWGAWLSGGTTVYYKRYPGFGLSSRYNKDDYYPPGWIGL